MKKHIQLLALALLAGAAAVYTACRKEEVTPEEFPYESQGAFKKEVTLFDSTGKNSVTIGIETDKECLLEAYNEQTLSLKVLDELSDENEAPENESPAAVEESSSDNPPVGMYLIRKNIRPDAKYWALEVDLTKYVGSRSCSNVTSGCKYWTDTTYPYWVRAELMNYSKCLSVWFVYPTANPTCHTGTPISGCGGSGGYYLCYPNIWVSCSGGYHSSALRVWAMGPSFRLCNNN